MPTAAELIAAVKQDGPDVLDRWAPWIDELTDAAGAAAFLGVKREAVYRAQLRDRREAPGGSQFPGPDRVFGRSRAWKYRTLVLHRAASPGRGGATRFKPGQAGNPSGGSAKVRARKTS